MGVPVGVGVFVDGAVVFVAGAVVFVAAVEVLVAVVDAPDTWITTEMVFPKYCPLSLCILHQPV